MAETATSTPRPSGDEAPVSRPKVIYVMGAGRSGSTILGVTLGNSSGVFYAGELDAWLARSGQPQLQDPERMRFWAAVQAQVGGARELYGTQAQRAIERSLSVFRIQLWPVRRRLRGPYRRVAESLYRAVQSVSGAEVIVDSSHYPLRAAELQALTGIDLYLVFLLRDPQSVVASFNRRDVAQYRKDTLTSNVYLWLTTLLSVIVFLRHPRERRLFVRYEDFIADPSGVVSLIAGMTGAHAPPPDFSALRTGLPFQGNRVIHSEVLALESRPPKPGPRSRLTAMLQLPLAPLLARLAPTTSTLGRGGHARATGQ
jgi:hypothetical protein